MKTELICSECGAKGQGSCECGVAYMPKSKIAVKAIKANPKLSDQAIAKKIGVSQPTISRARKQLKHNVLTERREGRDGKMYPAKKKRKGVRPFTKDNGRTEMVNLACWFDMMRAKLKERFDRVLKQAAKDKKFSEHTRDTMVDDINYLKQDLDRWIAQLDAIQLPEEKEETNVIPLRKHRRKPY
jgi:DNA-binding transcriptional MocR family regulator